MDTAHVVGHSGTVRPSVGARILQLVKRAVAPVDAAPRPVRYTPLLLGYVACCVGGAALALARELRTPTDWQSLLVGAFFVLMLARTAARQVPGVDAAFSATVLLQIGMVLTFGAAGALAAATAEALGAHMRQRVGGFRIAFNTANILLSDLAAWGGYTIVWHFGMPGPWAVVASGLAAGLVTWIVNNALLAGVLAARATSIRAGMSYLRSTPANTPSYLLYGLAGAGFPVLHNVLGTAGIVTLVGPLIAAQAFLVTLSRATDAHNLERQEYVALVEKQNVDLDAQRIEVVRAYDATLIALTNALDARDKETEGHSRRVVEYSRAIGKILGLDGDQMRVLSHGALLHDIGKIGVPDNILLKPGKLTHEEWELMRRHPTIGEAMVRDVDVLREARRIILHHHERWDGSGYPRGLRGREIDQGARIFAIADACDAITQDRPYRRAASLDRARDEILRGRGLEFDPDAVDGFLALTEDDLNSIRRLRTPPGLDLLIDSEARTRYLASLGLGARLIPA